MSKAAEIAKFTPDIYSTRGEGLTREVARFVHETGYDALPIPVIELGKKHVLDGLGLALAGSVADEAIPAIAAWGASSAVITSASGRCWPTP